MPKCDNCDKPIAKKSAILECNKCSKTVHANQACTGLTSKQLAALRNAENLEWTCEDCRRESPRHKSFIQEEEEEEDQEELVITQGNDSGSSAMKKLLSDISFEVKKAVKKEIGSVNEALSSCCQKMNGIMDTLAMISGKMKELENKNTYLMNQNKHLELKIEALEQYIGNHEQKQLNNTFEVAGVPEIKNENTEIIINTLATKLNIEKKDINTVKRLKGKNGKEGVIQVSLKQEEQVDQWIRAARKVTTLAEDIVSCPDPAVARTKIMIRRALSSANKTLLWQAKLKLKDTYKYIWFQGGKILVRRNDNDKPVVIRNSNDIDKMAMEKNVSR